MDPATRERLLARFAAYLDTIEGPLPQAGGDEPDLYTLLAELSALKNEVRIESRQVRAALDQFGALFDTLREANARLGEDLGRQRERETLARREAQQDLLRDLLDLRDRLQAGSDQARRYHPGWLARRSGAGGFVGGMAEGLAMNLQRLDEILARRDVHPLEAVGRPFDPQTMHAVDARHDRDQDPGVVLEEIRRGFLHQGRLLRLAEVIVNQRDGTS
jgi:molecular chaperone GrpE